MGWVLPPSKSPLPPVCSSSVSPFDIASRTPLLTPIVSKINKNPLKALRSNEGEMSAGFKCVVAAGFGRWLYTRVADWVGEGREGRGEGGEGEVDILKGRVRELKSSVKELRGELRVWGGRRGRVKDREVIGDLRGRVRELEGKVREGVRRGRKFEREREGREKEIRVKEGEIERLKKEGGKDDEGEKGGVCVSTEEWDGIQLELEGLEVLEGQVREAQVGRKEAEGIVKGLQMEIERMGGEGGGRKTREEWDEEARMAFEGKDVEINEIKERLEEKVKEVEEAKAESRAFKTKLEEKEEEVGDLEKAKDMLEGHVKKTESELEEARSKLEESLAEFEALKAENEDATSDNKEMEETKRLLEEVRTAGAKLALSSNHPPQ